MNFAPAGTTPFPVAAKVLPPNWGQQGDDREEGEQSHSYMCRLPVANARLSAPNLLASPASFLLSLSPVTNSLCTRAFVLLWLTFRYAVNAAYDRK